MKKSVLLLSFLLSISSLLVSVKAFSVTESGGWFESAFVKWAPKSDADSYNVYYSGGGVSNVKIDNFLIRRYPGYFRADIVGLKAGNYTITIKPVVSGVEGRGITTSTLNVKSHDRSGFAFKNGRVPGAYKADGTLKDNAVVLYITEKTKNTIKHDVAGATSNPCVGLQEIFDGFKKGKDTRPLVVRIIGNVSHLANMQNGDVVVENKNNAQSYITIEGIGDDAVANGWGIRLKSASNVEIRNLGFMNCNSSEGDNIGLQQKNDHIWVHHCDMFYGHAGRDSDQQKGDGALDVKGSTNVTISYNHYWDTGKTNLLGLGEKTTDGLYITYHHNWFDHSDSRHPRVRYYSAHVYNNFYDGISKYGAGTTSGASVFMEKNYFRNCKYPMMISMQGTDVYDASKGQNDYKSKPTFSKEDGGIIKAFDNYIVGAQRFVAYGDTKFPNPTVDFDAYVVSSRNQTVPSSVTTYQGNKRYNNFDTNSSIMYQYTADSPADAMNKVIQYSGRMFGGDFKWTFNNSVDDNSYAVNVALKSALTNYKSQLLAIQGDGSNSGTITPETPTPETPSNPQQPVVGDEAHNFTLSGKESSFYTIIGNLSTSRGSVDYAGMTLTQCLKLESATSIKFTINKPGNLLLVFSDGFNGRVKINGVDYRATNGILEVELAAGSHTISKRDTADLFYMSIKGQAEPETPETPGNSQQPVAGNETHNFTISGKENSFYTIIGNLSTSRGSVDYAGMRLTQCLKLESATSIKFTINKPGNLLLVFSDGFNGRVKINGVDYRATNGILEVELAAGSHTISKRDTADLFYMSINGQAGSQSPEVPVAINETHNFTTVGKESTFYAINGNLSSIRGVVNYDGMTLTQCLKLESATSIKFTLDKSANLLLVFTDGFNGRVKINGVDYRANNGKLEIELAAGSYTISKRDTADLFYMSVSGSGGLKSSDNFVSQPEIALYPNPVIDKLYISSMENISKVDIYNLSGVNVKSVVGSQLESVDVGNLPQGSYVIIVTLEDGNLFKQIILKK